ncbi:uncharacterized protein [Amphiura filiformis]|uniref:uncharacterized protein isoform X2 n=1 Tax=Amphiura filiformis TaxID=82378 RepID=UPI003B21E511
MKFALVVVLALVVVVVGQRLDMDSCPPLDLPDNVIPSILCIDDCDNIPHDDNIPNSIGRPCKSGEYCCWYKCDTDETDDMVEADEMIKVEKRQLSTSMYGSRCVKGRNYRISNHSNAKHQLWEYCSCISRSTE